jgi:hypothetical protein
MELEFDPPLHAEKIASAATDKVADIVIAR